MTFDGVALLAVIAGLICLYLIFHYLEWRVSDRRRREDRLIHRNLVKHTGGGRA